MPKKATLSIILFLLCFIAQSQTSYQIGYFIDEHDERTECLIKDTQPYNTPVSFTYKLTETSTESFSKHLKDVKEFGIYQRYSFQKFALEIDRTGYDENTTDFDLKPHFESDTLFLELIVNGPAKLFKYRDGSLLRFFYSTAEVPIKQLVYKKYKYHVMKTPRENRFFVQQLSDDLKCGEVHITEINKLTYTESDLKPFFIRYNTCTDPDYLPMVKKKKRGKLNVNVKAGVSHASFQLNNEKSDRQDADYGEQWSPSGGMKIEYVLPIRNNKWSLTLEPYFHRFYAERPVSFSNSYATINTIGLPLGARHYFYLNDKMGLYVGASLGIYLMADSRIEYDIGYNTLELSTPLPSPEFSIGFKYDDRYSIDFRYASLNGLERALYFYNEFRICSVTLGYSFLSTKD